MTGPFQANQRVDSFLSSQASQVKGPNLLQFKLGPCALSLRNRRPDFNMAIAHDPFELPKLRSSFILEVTTIYIPFCGLRDLTRCIERYRIFRKRQCCRYDSSC